MKPCLVKYFKWFAKSNQRAKGFAWYLAWVLEGALGAFRTHGGYMGYSAPLKEHRENPDHKCLLVYQSSDLCLTHSASSIAKLGHTGARVLPIGSCALPLEVCPNSIKQLL